MSNDRIIIYNDDKQQIHVEARLEDENVWLTQRQIVTLFQTAKSTVSEHIKNIYTDCELSPEATVRKIRTVQQEGARKVSQVIYFRVDSDKPFAGLTHFKGSSPTQAEAMVAKNYLTEQELRVLNNLVSAYFDLAELNAIEEREMSMTDYVRELNNILSSTGRKLLDNAGSISHPQAESKAKSEYKKFKEKTLDTVEESYLKTINALEKKAKQESHKK